MNLIERKKRILLISAFVNCNKDNNSRVNVIYDKLCNNADVTILTTDFNHAIKKKYDDLDKKFRKSRRIQVSAYSKNISLSRIKSHIIFAFGVRQFLKKNKEKYDTIYCTMPTSLSAFFCAKYCVKNEVKLVIDVIDLWPESFIVLSKFNFFFKILTYPWSLVSRFAYSSADILVGESKKYAEYAQIFNRKTKALPIYLGVNLKKAKKLREESNIILKKSDNEVWICYGGSLGLSYDFDVILKAYKKISGKYKNRVKLFFIGGGQLELRIKKYAEEFDQSIVVTGNLKYNDYLKYLSYMDVAINSFKQNTQVVHSYKFNDYIVSGLATINNLIGETADLVNEFQIGLNFDYIDNKLENCLEKIIKSDELRENCKKNTKTLAQNVLSQDIIYKELIDLILK